MTVLVLGDQLTTAVGPLSAVEPGTERVLMVEACAFARRKPYHPHKLVLVFAAMRQFRDRLRDAGHAVEYRQSETFGDALDDHLEAHPGDELTVIRPASHGAADRLRSLVAARGGSLTVVENELFLCSRERFDDWADGRDHPYRHEQFYRMMRRETGYLMADGDPIGGEWNYDERNRETPPPEYEPPVPPAFEPDETTRAVLDWVEAEFDGGDWADPGPFRWPVTRAEALTTLDHFVDRRLTEFGPYQDAMRHEEWALDHSLLSVPLNLGLLQPDEVVETVVEAAGPDVPVNSLEGFVRQIIGWREFVRHAYRDAMPDLATANRLGAERDLPACYWTGETEMACLEDAVEGVRERGYAHHIQRLMVLSNFALLYGVEPRELNRWFHATFVDAYHWVTTPNVVEMGLYAGGVFATKPYAASANYVDRMSDYCADCRYDPDATVGADACPLNALYWDFLAEHEDTLRENHRMGLVYSHWDDRTDDERAAIRDRAAAVREQFD